MADFAAFKKSDEKIEINKDSIIKMDSGLKQVWILILSWLEMEEILEIKRVCKTFYFIFKEEEKFWKLYTMKCFGVYDLPKENRTWRSFFLDLYYHSNLKWDIQNKGKEIKISPDGKSLATGSNYVNWK